MIFDLSEIKEQITARETPTFEVPLRILAHLFISTFVDRPDFLYIGFKSFRSRAMLFFCPTVAAIKIPKHISQ